VDTSGPPAKLTGLDYKANLNGGTIVVKTDKPVAFTTRKNAGTNQFVLELPNTSAPKRFRQPYDTKEFGGPIASINTYQSQGTTRVVVQLREQVEPSVYQSGNVISIAGQGGGAAQAQNQVQDQAAASEQTSAPGDQSAQDSNQHTETGEETATNTVHDDGGLQRSSVDDYAFGQTNKFYGRPISLELKDADIRDVFAFISEESGLNIVIADDVQGKVTLKLRQIPWDQALLVILQSKQLGYVRQGKILRVAPLSTLQHESDQARQVLESQRNLEPLHVQVFPISYASVADIEAQVKDFLSSRGKSHSDKRTNNLVVTDIDENLIKIKALVKRLDTQTPQVLIEAKVIEASEQFNRIVGVNWGFTGNQVQTGTNSQGSPVYFTPNLSSGSSGATPPFLLGGFTLGTLDVFGDVNASLSLLETEGLAKILSAPRIVTLDRQLADIKQSTQIPTFTATTSTTTGTGGTTIPLVIPQIQYVTVNLELSVTPQITVDGSIIMTLDVQRQFADPTVVVGQSQAPPIESREAKTQVLIENGDTLVIGGIYQSDTQDSEAGIPWLSKLPLLGWLFKNSNVSRQKNELVIFLTPRILNRDKAFGKSNDLGPTGIGRPVGGDVPATSAPPNSDTPGQGAPAQAPAPGGAG
jgi:type IV pilus assembly protein PilQ